MREAPERIKNWRDDSPRVVRIKLLCAEGLKQQSTASRTEESDNVP